MSDMLSRELQEWLDRESESVIVEITREDTRLILHAIARARMSSRKPEIAQMYDRLLSRWVQATGVEETD